MVTVEVDRVCVESRLVGGAISCPACPDGVLGGWGYARARHVEGLDAGDGLGRIPVPRVTQGGHAQHDGDGLLPPPGLGKHGGDRPLRDHRTLAAVDPGIGRQRPATDQIMVVELHCRQ